LLNVQDSKKQYPWQQWADAPVNLFYMVLGKKRIPVIDIRTFFFQLSYGNKFLTSLDKLGEYLSEHFKEDLHKLPKTLGEDFGKRPPNADELSEFQKYAIRDAYITAKGAEWVHQVILEGWLKNEVSITKLFSWGTVAKYYFNLPKLNQVERFGNNKMKITFPNKWHERIECFAGRNEAFWTGNVGHVSYNDIASLYPVSMIRTQCMLIKNLKAIQLDKSKLLGKLTWQKFHEVTGFPYGWILGDFSTTDDLWALPTQFNENNIFVTGRTKSRLLHTLDLEASSAQVLDIDSVLVPVFDEGQRENMRKFEELTMKKMNHDYASDIEKYCIKNTANSTSGILGKSHPYFGDTTNMPAYNTLLAQSHLDMSRIFHMYDSPEHPIYYTDTDSFFWDYTVEKVIEQCEPYPSLPYQTIDTVPLEVGLKGVSCENGAVIFRGKMYYQNPNSFAFSGWKPFPKFFLETIRTKPYEIDVERQLNRKWRTRDKKATVLRTGRWLIVKEYWDLAKLRAIFRADSKRNRVSLDSYALFLDGQKQSSKAWDTSDVERLRELTMRGERLRKYFGNYYEKNKPSYLEELEIDSF
jgi:hypothetical protein